MKYEHRLDLGALQAERARQKEQSRARRARKRLKAQSTQQAERSRLSAEHAVSSSLTAVHSSELLVSCLSAFLTPSMISGSASFRSSLRNSGSVAYAKAWKGVCTMSQLRTHGTEGGVR